MPGRGRLGRATAEHELLTLLRRADVSLASADDRSCGPSGDNRSCGEGYPDTQPSSAYFSQCSTTW